MNSHSHSIGTLFLMNDQLLAKMLPRAKSNLGRKNMPVPLKGRGGWGHLLRPSSTQDLRGCLMILLMDLNCANSICICSFSESLLIIEV